MKKKLALLMAAIMTVAMVPATAFASTKLTAVDEVTANVDQMFVSRVELSKSNDQVDVEAPETDGSFAVKVKLTNGKFAKYGDQNKDLPPQYHGDDDDYINDNNYNIQGISDMKVDSDTAATIWLDADIFNGDDNSIDACVLPIIAKAVDTGDVIATFTSNVSAFKTANEVIATAVDGDVDITIDGVTTFVEDADDTKKIKDITINEITPDVLLNEDPVQSITFKLKGNFKFYKDNFQLIKDANGIILLNPTYTDPDDYAAAYAAGDIATVQYLNENVPFLLAYVDDDEVQLLFSGELEPEMLTDITISGIKLTATKDCDAGDVGTITVKSDDGDFDSVKLEAAKMVEEAVTYSVEDKDLPTIWAGKNYFMDFDSHDLLDDANTLKLSIEENTGDILNTSRKATFTFPKGIEVCDITDLKGVSKVNPNDYKDGDFHYEIDDNVVTIYNYQKGDDESEDKVDMDIKFILNAAPTFSGDVTVTLGGQFDDVSFKVATVKAPYTVEAKTSEVLIDYRYVPVKDIVITEAEDGILEDGDKIVLAVDKMDFEDAGDVNVTEGDIDVDVDIDDDFSVFDIEKPIDGDLLYEDKDAAYLVVTVNDASTEASTIVISGLELYLDRTLPVGGYALQNVGGVVLDDKGEGKPFNILWGNSIPYKVIYDYDYDSTEVNELKGYVAGFFKYEAVTVNDEYVNVITAARDSDDSMIVKKIVITVGATTMTAGTETVTLDAPAYINAENYTMLPLRAISEAFGATVNWDAATKSVTILRGQRVISMSIGSKTMYVNGTPVAMNTAPEISAERTFVPVRDLANAFGISNINWAEASGTVTLN